MKAFLKFAGFILLKHLILGLYYFNKPGTSDWDWSRVKTTESIIYTFGMLLALPLLEMIILILPFQLALKQKGWVAIIILIFAFVLEFIIGWYATNQNLEVWMVVKIILSVVLFFFMYRKQLNFFRKVV